MPDQQRGCCKTNTYAMHAPGCIYSPREYATIQAPSDEVAGTKEINGPSILEEAQGLIYGDRQQQYGNARTNFGDIARLWHPIIGVRISPEAVALCLLQLKVARAINDIRASNPIKRDTVVDLAGYAGCIEKIQKGL